jgi:hypothetical protein
MNLEDVEGLGAVHMRDSPDGRFAHHDGRPLDLVHIKLVPLETRKTFFMQEELPSLERSGEVSIVEASEPTKDALSCTRSYGQFRAIPTTMRV